jgi:hypothetical protein
MVSRFALFLSLIVAALPVAAGAQNPDQAGAAPAALPSYARPVAPSDEETIRGRVSAFDGKYDLKVRDDRGFIDDVRLHQGTIINPTGITLRPGMSVTINGYNRGHVFEANQIDTPYSAYGLGPYAYPPYPYYGPYPYGYYAAPGFVFAPRFGFHWR